MMSTSSGKEQQRKLSLVMGRQKKDESDLKIISSTSSIKKAERFRLLDTVLVNKANLIFETDEYVGELLVIF